MKIHSRMTCLCCLFMTITPYTPQQFLSLAKTEVSVPEKISLLKRLADSFLLDSTSAIAREQLVNLLTSSNRYEEALIEYKRNHPGTQIGRNVDFKLGIASSNRPIQ